MQAESKQVALEATPGDDNPEFRTPGKESCANNCLLARRLVENGTRFVQLFDWGWDSHGDSEKHATLLHLMGIEASRFSYPYQGLNQKLVGVKPTKVITDLLA